MSTAAGAPSNGPSAGAKSPDRKKKGKSAVASPDVSMEEEDEEDEDEDEEEIEEEEDGDDEDDEDELEEIDPDAIVGRRTRGLKVDYTSKEALEKAGLAPEEDEEEEDEMKS